MGRAAAAASGEAEPAESFIEPASQTALADATAELPGVLFAGAKSLRFNQKRKENAPFNRRMLMFSNSRCSRGGRQGRHLRRRSGRCSSTPSGGALGQAAGAFAGSARATTGCVCTVSVVPSPTISIVTFFPSSSLKSSLCRPANTRYHGCAAPPFAALPGPAHNRCALRWKDTTRLSVLPMAGCLWLSALARDREVLSGRAGMPYDVNEF
jgi:hypothetical protein